MVTDTSPLDDAGAHAAGRLVAPAAHHWRAGLEAGQLGHLGSDAPRDGGRFDHLEGSQLGECPASEHRLAPAPLRHIQQHGARGVRHPVAYTPVSR